MTTPTGSKAALARRGVEAAEVDAVIEADMAHRARVATAEAMRAEVKELSRQVGQAKKEGDDDPGRRAPAAQPHPR